MTPLLEIDRRRSTLRHSAPLRGAVCGYAQSITGTSNPRAVAGQAEFSQTIHETMHCRPLSSFNYGLYSCSHSRL